MVTRPTDALYCKEALAIRPGNKQCSPLAYLFISLSYVLPWVFLFEGIPGFI